MLNQTCKPKSLGFIKALALIILLIVAVMGAFIGFTLLSLSNPTVWTAGSFLVLFLIGYFVLKPLFCSYEYSFDGDVLSIEQKSGSRCIKQVKIDKGSVEKIEASACGKRLYPYGQKACTVFADNKKYSLALNENMLAYLKCTRKTDAFIDSNFDSMLIDLQKLIAIPSVKAEPKDNMPFGEPCAKALEETLKLCERFGMRTKNVDNYCGWAEIGEGEKLIGILCHLDVVPASDGWSTDPFTAVITDEEIFGRGAIDDKGPCVAAIYSVAAVKESLGEIPCRIRLIFGCDEESGWACMDKYVESEESPDLAFTPDGEYPVIITEKGMGFFEINSNLEEGAYQLYVQGGMRPNMVPDKATATVIGDVEKFADKLDSLSLDERNVAYTINGNVLELTSLGVSAHGSTPEEGVNAFFQLFKVLDALDLKDSQGKFVKDVMSIFVDSTDGKGANLKLYDDISGPLTLNLGMCFVGKNSLYPEMNDDDCKIVIDIRYPVTYSFADISALLQSALPHSWDFEVEHSQPPHHVDADSPLVSTLMDVYREYTNRDDQPLAIGGGTYARAFPGKAVAFGVQFLDRPHMAHQSNESIFIEDLRISAKMFAAAIERLAKLQ